ncbi:hypothetical protein FALBO_12666 [Fusarium albosuccineum]|uniref:Uncharacterized protein n=1 Tax=Fusarium albosuccineum TaxID=1237068 RepID=A0A8H4L3H3_9HYPO|nr:hypothetical protein FALBO_12666 [Fusarium albosuccineum]KAF4986300.1 hypothetical protein FDECE_16021 [Fusarium decemcellulare]
MSALPPQKFLTLTPAPKSNFLSLAPATSPSYPKKPATRAHVRAANVPEDDSSRPAPPRRSSTGSTSSSSSSNGYRILKLGPVHYGEHADDHKHDFHDIILH